MTSFLELDKSAKSLPDTHPISHISHKPELLLSVFFFRLTTYTQSYNDPLLLMMSITNVYFWLTGYKPEILMIPTLLGFMFVQSLMKLVSSPFPSQNNQPSNHLPQVPNIWLPVTPHLYPLVHSCLATSACPTLCNSMDHTQAGSGVHGFPKQEYGSESSYFLLQGASWLRDQNCISCGSCNASGFFTNHRNLVYCSHHLQNSKAFRKSLPDSWTKAKDAHLTHKQQGIEMFGSLIC